MRPPDALAAYAREALAAGHPPEAVAAAARSAGWTPAEAQGALDAWAVAGALPPVPRPRTRARIDAGDALRHAILFSALGVVVLNLGIVAFALIDAYAAPGGGDGYVGTLVRYAVAALLVAWPVWAWQSLAIARATRTEAGQIHGGAGRWLTAIALFIAASVVICDAVLVLGAFLAGETTVVFLLQALVVGALAAAVFAAYRPSLETEEAP